MEKKHLLLIMGFSLFFGLILLGTFFQPQTVHGQILYLTPTPDDRGRVIYVVQAGDSCISIALKNGISEADLRLLNNLTGDDCTVYPGEELLLKIVEEPTPMPEQPTVTPIFPTPTPFEGYVEICVHLYEDINGNAQRDDEIEEALLGGGAASVTDPLALKSSTGVTVQYEPLCFSELSAGEYNVSIAVPEGYNSTSINSSTVHMEAGDTTIVNFGAQQSSQFVGAESDDEVNNASGGGGNPLMALVGGLMLVVGGGLGIYMSVTAKRRQNEF